MRLAPISLLEKDWVLYCSKSQDEIPGPQFICGWSVGGRDMGDTLEATHVAMADWAFNEGKEVDEVNCWADTINWATFEAQLVLVLPEHSMSCWETIHR